MRSSTLQHTDNESLNATCILLQSQCSISIGTSAVVRLHFPKMLMNSCNTDQELNLFSLHSALLQRFLPFGRRRETFPDPLGSYGRSQQVWCKSSVELFYCPGPWQQQVPSGNNQLHQRGPEIRGSKVIQPVQEDCRAQVCKYLIKIIQILSF